MDKQMIEEMARASCGKYNNGGCEIDGWVCTCKCKHYKVAESFYNKLLFENAVVLTREQDTKLFNDYVEYVKRVRKETAEKFAERLKEIANRKLEFYFVQTKADSARVGK